MQYVPGAAKNGRYKSTDRSWKEEVEEVRRPRFRATAPATGNPTHCESVNTPYTSVAERLVPCIVMGVVRVPSVKPEAGTPVTEITEGKGTEHEERTEMGIIEKKERKQHAML